MEHGSLNQVNAIVIHRTAGSTYKGTLAEYQSAKVGAHFLITKSGTIYQTASLKFKCWHVGKIQSRCRIEGTCTEAENQALVVANSKKTWVQNIHNIEKSKAYPTRYPVNDDSIGIEVVGEFNQKED